MSNIIRDVFGRFVASSYWLGKKRDKATKLKISNSLKGIKLPESQKTRMKSSAHRGNEHFAWKGDEAGYRSMHIWVETNKGKAKFCEHCYKTNGRFHWANIDHKYRRVLDDYKSLCVKCHKAYDKKYD